MKQDKLRADEKKRKEEEKKKAEEIKSLFKPVISSQKVSFTPISYFVIFILLRDKYFSYTVD